MIHAITITAETDFVKLRKEMRKKLMTGGAVVRIDPSTSAAELEEIARRSSAEYQRHAIAELVLEEVARNAHLTPQLARTLVALESPVISARIVARADFSQMGVDTSSSDVPPTLLFEQVESVEQASPEELRTIFEANRGASDDEVSSRTLLCRAKALPDDLRDLLRRDTSRKVRFHAWRY